MENSFWNGLKLGLTRRELSKVVGWALPSLLLADFIGFGSNWKTALLIWFAVSLAGVIEKIWPGESNYD